MQARPNCFELIQRRVDAEKFAWVRLDPDPRRMPTFLEDEWRTLGAVTRFCDDLVNATHPFVSAYVLSLPAFLGFGPEGMQALEESVRHIRNQATDLPVVLEVGSAHPGYAHLAFSLLRADGVVLDAPSDPKTLKPFLGHDTHGIFLSYGSNLRLARRVADVYRERPNWGVVVNAGPAKRVAEMRSIVGDNVPLMISVRSAQRDFQPLVEAGQNSEGRGMTFGFSDSVMYAFSRSRRWRPDQYVEAAVDEVRRANAAIAGCLVPA
jgi:hypothetical protein